MMDFLDLFLKFIATLAVVIGGLWALTRYIIERGLVPAAELSLDCDFIGEKNDLNIIEITVYISNKGSSILVAKDIRLAIKTISSSDSISQYTDKKKFGRLRFPGSLSKKLSMDGNNKKLNAFTLVPFNTFVQSGVKQAYSFVTPIKNNVEFIHVHAEFQYAQNPLKVQNAILWLSRKLGLIQYSLQKIYIPHSVQKAFNVTNLTDISRRQPVTTST